MSIPITFAPILKQDFTLNPIQVHKRFVIGSASFSTTESGYIRRDAIYLGEKMKIGEPGSSYPTNSIDGTYMNIIWNQIDSRYYRFPYDSCATLEHSNRRFTYKHLGITGSVIICPQQDFGESIKPGSVYLINSSFDKFYRDDGNGNLYDYSIDPTTSSIDINRNHLVGYWGFNEEFRKLNGVTGTIADDSFEYLSNVESERNSRWKNIGLILNSNSPSNNNTHAALFTNQSIIVTEKADQFNFTGDFSIGFWIKAPLTQSLTESSSILISKGGLVRKFQKQSDGIYTASFINENLNVYPFRFELGNYNHNTFPNRIKFSRSDGINTASIVINSVIGDSFYNHIAIVKTGSIIESYFNGSLATSIIDGTDNTYNDHALTFGSRDLQFNNQFSGSLDEIKFYNYAWGNADGSQLAAMADTYTFSTPVVGNVFYRTGTIVFSPLYANHWQLFNEGWQLEYKGTHTIYEYECLVRIKKGSFNLTQNPSALQFPKGDLLINDFTGSLYPYATSIGLYNDSGELMAVAKLGQPLQMRDDVDINVAIRWDA